MVTIRRLTADDAEVYRDIRLEGLTRYPEAFGASLEAESVQALTFFAERLQERFVFGGFDGAALIGVAGYYREPEETVRHKGVLFGMYVRAAARRQGLAQRLVEITLADARGELEWMQLRVGTDNAPALRLYETCGFARYGVEPCAIKVDGSCIDEALMYKRLDG